VGAALGAALCAVAARAAGLDDRAATRTAAYVVPGLVAVYLVLIAADLVASDVSTRRIETLALLPARPVLIWTAKLAFLLLAGLLFLAWTAAVLVALHLHSGGVDAARELARHADLALPQLSLALGLACTVLFFSTVLERGVSAVWAAASTFAAAGLVFLAADGGALDGFLRPWHLGLGGLVVAIAFATGSALAFTSGGIHLVGRLRRGLLGIACVSLLLLLPATLCAEILI